MPTPAKVMRTRNTQNIYQDENAIPKPIKKPTGALLTRKALSNISNTIGNQQVKINPFPSELPKKIQVRKKSVPATKPKTQKSNFSKVEKKDLKVEDVDALNKGNIVFFSDYASDVFKYLFCLESKYKIKRWPLNVNVSKAMRRNVINWLAIINNKYDLGQETIHLAVSYLDRSLAKNLPKQKNLKLLALCCLSIAIKYEETVIVSLAYLLPTIEKECQLKDFKQTEAEVLKTLGFDLARPSAVCFLRRFHMVTRPTPIQHVLAKFFIDLCLLDASFCHVKPSLVAAGAVYVAICVSKADVSPQFWPDNLTVYSTYSYDKLKPIVSKIAQNVLDPIYQTSSVVEKYSSFDFHFAAQYVLKDKENMVLRKLSVV